MQLAVRRTVAASLLAVLAAAVVVLPSAHAQARDHVTVTATQQGPTQHGEAWAAQVTIVVAGGAGPPGGGSDEEVEDPDVEEDATPVDDRDPVTLEEATLDGVTLTCPQTRVERGERATPTCRTSTLPQDIDVTAGLTVRLSDSTGTWTQTVTINRAQPITLEPDLDITLDFPNQAITDGQVRATVRVANTGDTTFSRLTVTADRCTPTDPAVTAARNPGGTAATRCDLPTGSGELAVTITGTWNSPDGPQTRTWTAEGTYQTATATLAVTTSDVDLTPGGNVTYNLTARNTGDVPLTTSAPAIGGATQASCTLGTIAPGATATTSCTISDLPQTYDPTRPVTVTFTGGDSTFTESATVNLGPMELDPAIDVEFDMPTTAAGTDATATTRLTIEGDVTFSTVTVDAGACPNGPTRADVTEPGDRTDHTCDYTAAVTDPNTVTVVGTYATAGGSQTITVTANTDGAVAAISLRPRHDPLYANVADGPATARFDLTVTGVAPVTNVTVTTNVEGCDLTLDRAQPGTRTLDCTTPANTPTVEAATTATIGGVTVEDTTDATLIWYGATLTAHIDSTWDRTTLDVPVALTLANVGLVPLTDATVRTDPFEPSCRNDITDRLPIEPDGHITIECHRAASTWPAASARPHPDHASGWQRPTGLAAVATVTAADHVFTLDNPAELDLDGTIDLVATTARGRTIDGVELDATLLAPTRFEQHLATVTCPFADGCDRERRRVEESDGGTTRLDPAAAGTWHVKATAPAGWRFAATGESTIDLGHVDVLPGRGQFDPAVIDVEMVAAANPLLRLTNGGIAGLLGLLSAIGLALGWRHAGAGDPPWA